MSTAARFALLALVAAIAVFTVAFTVSRGSGSGRVQTADAPPAAPIAILGAPETTPRIAPFDAADRLPDLRPTPTPEPTIAPTATSAPTVPPSTGGIGGGGGGDTGGGGDVGGGGGLGGGGG